VNNNDFILESHNILTAKGSGTVDLPNQSINYVLKIRGLNIGDVSKYDLPIDVKGPLASPSITPNVGAVVQQVPGDVLKQQAEKLKSQFIPSGNNQGGSSQALAQQGQKLLKGLFK
jgi:hypothetical protein